MSLGFPLSIGSEKKLILSPRGERSSVFDMISSRPPSGERNFRLLSTQPIIQVFAISF